MKKLLFSILFLSVVLITTTAFQASQSECDIRNLKNELLFSLRPDFKYSSSKVDRFKYTNSEQVIEVEAPLLKGQSFKFLFNIGGLPKDIDIKIYDKKGKGKQQLFVLSDLKKEGQTVYSFEPTVSNTLYITYILPRTTKQDVYGCLVSVIGYKVN
jgi:hypothetical protein